MTHTSAPVQTSVATGYDKYAAGQIASGIPFSTLSARFADSSANQDHNLPFGYGVGWVGEAAVSQDINRHPIGAITATVANNATTIQFDPDGSSVQNYGANVVNVGDFIRIQDETFLVTALGASVLTVVGGQKGSSRATHTYDSSAPLPIYKLNSTSTFAGVVVRDRTLAGRFNSAQVDHFINGETVPVGFSGDFVVACTTIITASDVGADVFVYGGGTNKGQFTLGVSNDDDVITIRGAKFISTSEDRGTGQTPRYLAVARFVG